MASSYEDIRTEYIAEMRKIMPSVLSWWKANAVREHTDLDRTGPQNDFETRWPAGPVAHPKVLYVFRTYFLQAHELNRENEMHRTPRDDRPQESDWGADDDDDDVDYVLPIDLLVHDLEEIAPDVFDIVSHLAFVPVGQSPDEEFC